MDAKRFGAIIQRCRKDQNMTQSELGEKLGVTDKAISRWERGIGFPDINLLQPLTEALKISLPELLSCEKKDIEKTSLKQNEEVISNYKNALWVRKHRRIIAVLCLLIYMLFCLLMKSPLLVEQLFWLRPLNRVLFIVMAVSFHLASYQEVSDGID